MTWPAMMPPVPQDDHACPLLPLTDDEAVRVLVDVLRGTSSASAVVERLGRRGLRVGRVP